MELEFIIVGVIGTFPFVMGKLPFMMETLGRFPFMETKFPLTWLPFAFRSVPASTFIFFSIL